MKITPVSYTTVNGNRIARIVKGHAFRRNCSVAIVIDSRTLNNPVFELIGQSLLVFGSVVGGALFFAHEQKVFAQFENEGLHVLIALIR